MAKKKNKSNVKNHVLIPKHEKLSEKEKKTMLEKYNVSLKELPKITKEDPAIESLNVKEGDIIKITRKSETAGKAVFYRGVISE
ncbi:DNA-directed RNA polymerase subunit H [Candidatus Woesearchaeota archaeon]|nr:DNA-directed RNA polymerase subunit H [Candidatus Woesearchaeota archaeon]